MTSLAVTGPACLVADLGSQNPLDVKALAGAVWNGIRCAGVILRATRSNETIDAAFATRFAAAEAAGLLVGAYDFNTGETAAIQAARFLKMTAACGPILRVIDFERNPSGGQMSFATMLEWLDRVDQATGHAAALYSGDQLKTAILGATDAQRGFLALHPLWGCEYGPAFKMLDDAGKPLPWPAPALWQFSGDGVGPLPHSLPGLQPGADLSIFNGSAEALAKAWPGAPVSPAGSPQPSSVAATDGHPSSAAGPSNANAGDGWLAGFKRLIGSIGA